MPTNDDEGGKIKVSLKEVKFDPQQGKTFEGEPEVKEPVKHSKCSKCPNHENVANLDKTFNTDPNTKCRFTVLSCKPNGAAEQLLKLTVTGAPEETVNTVTLKCNNDGKWIKADRQVVEKVECVPERSEENKCEKCGPLNGEGVDGLQATEGEDKCTKTLACAGETNDFELTIKTGMMTILRKDHNEVKITCDIDGKWIYKKGDDKIEVTAAKCVEAQKAEPCECGKEPPTFTNLVVTDKKENECLVKELVCDGQDNANAMITLTTASGTKEISRNGQSKAKLKCNKQAWIYTEDGMTFVVQGAKCTVEQPCNSCGPFKTGNLVPMDGKDNDNCNIKKLVCHGKDEDDVTITLSTAGNKKEISKKGKVEETVKCNMSGEWSFADNMGTEVVSEAVCTIKKPCQSCDAYDEHPSFVHTEDKEEEGCRIHPLLCRVSEDQTSRIQLTFQDGEIDEGIKSDTQTEINLHCIDQNMWVYKDHTDTERVVQSTVCFGEPKAQKNCKSCIEDDLELEGKVTKTVNTEGQCHMMDVSCPGQDLMLLDNGGNKIAGLQENLQTARLACSSEGMWEVSLNNGRKERVGEALCGDGDYEYGPRADP
ncbi:hypothetical protein L596_019721 [Steinernema carpocapsae]|uniref:C6 domain-containing protein n=1 Tax=Steinernema carpocapsae TaxID=34508 RepID=A0A4U5MRI6_STECR|nr:hypothetical protein L596_019721 [Steinernema carpocapsae]